MATYKSCHYREFQTWDGLRSALFDDAESGYVWRGVANADWCMETSLDRFAREHNLTDRATLEARLQDLYAVYLNERGIEHDASEDRLWALGQHWGLPTPLLDWSHSPMAALYFAASGNDPSVPAHRRDSCVWRLDYGHPAFAAGDVKRLDPGSGPWNERLRAQQGVFTRLQHRGCMLDVLAANAGYLDTVHAYVYPADLNVDILKDLSKMMITDLSMFPDHEGVIRHVRTLAGTP